MKYLQAVNYFDRLCHADLKDLGKHLQPRSSYSTKTAVISSSGLGASIVPTQAAALVIEISAEYGAFRTLNVIEAGSGKTRFPIATTMPRAAWISPAAQGTKLTADSTLTGGGIATESRELGVLIEVAIPLIEDSAADLDIVIPSLLGNGIADRIDQTCYSGDGADNELSGGQTGIFSHASVTSVSAANTHTRVESLEVDDLLRTIDACADSALTRAPRWWTHPGIFKKLLRLKDGSGAPLVRFEQGQPYILGYPVTLTTGAPSANVAGAKVICLGSGEAYLVAMLHELQVHASDIPKFDFFVRQFRGIVRVRCEMMEPTWFSTLKLAAA